MPNLHMSIGGLLVLATSLLAGLSMAAPPTLIFPMNKNINPLSVNGIGTPGGHLGPPGAMIIHPTNQQVPSTSILPQTNPYLNATHDILLELSQQLLTKSLRFDDHFRNLLSSSKLNLHNMFMDTYGMMYTLNTEIFTTMFENLEQYYADGRVRLVKSMEQFFERLYQKIFQALNSNRVFTPSYLECATEQLVHMKPFKDLPDKLIDSIRHAFVAARTFKKALNSGIDVINNIIKLGSPAHCNKIITEKLLRNITLTGNNQPFRLPCLNFCEQVITKCIGRDHLIQLNDRWRGYVVSLNEIAIKLSTSYNIETIIRPLDVQISEVIMNFQDNSASISDHIFKVCGRPMASAEPSLSYTKPTTNRLGRRSASPEPSPVVPGPSRHLSHTSNAFHQPLAALALGVPGLQADSRAPKNRDRLVGPQNSLAGELTPVNHESQLLIDEIRNFMMSTRSFWASLPNSVCNSTLGSSLLAKKQSVCFNDTFGFSDINSDVRYHATMQQQVSQLDSMRSKIDKALAGIEVDWDYNSLDQKPSPVNSMGSIANGRNPVVLASTTSTTTTTPEPIDDEMDEEDDLEHSGDHELNVPEMPPRVIDENADDTDFDRPDDVDPDNSEDSTSDVTTDYTSSTETSDHIYSDSDHQDNSIDKKLETTLDDLHTNLISAPGLAGARESNFASSKLVITFGGHMLFAFIMTASFVVNNFSTPRHQTLRSRSL